MYRVRVHCVPVAVRGLGFRFRLRTLCMWHLFAHPLEVFSGSDGRQSADALSLSHDPLLFGLCLQFKLSSATSKPTSLRLTQLTFSFSLQFYILIHPIRSNLSQCHPFADTSVPLLQSLMPSVLIKFVSIRENGFHNKSTYCCYVTN